MTKLNEIVRRVQRADKILIVRLVCAFVRVKFWQLSYGILGYRLKVGPGARFYGWPNITNAGSGSTITMQDHVSIGPGQWALGPGSAISIGARTSINYGLVISAIHSVKIGEDCLIGEYVTIRDNDHAFDLLSVPIKKQGLVGAPIVIEDDVWIARGVAILKGVTIGRGAVIAANAVVVKDVPPNAIVGGVPAKVIKFRSQ